MITGTSLSWSFRAASRRPWPAMMPALVSTKIDVEPELGDAGGDLRDLSVRMSSWVPGVWDELFD